MMALLVRRYLPMLYGWAVDFDLMRLVIVVDDFDVCVSDIELRFCVFDVSPLVVQLEEVEE